MVDSNYSSCNSSMPILFQVTAVAMLFSGDSKEGIYLVSFYITFFSFSNIGGVKSA